MPKPRVLRLLQGYYFDPKARRYMRVGKPGFVSRAKIMNLLEKSVAGRERRLYEGVRRLADGRRSPQMFLSHAKRMLKRQYLQEAALAAGGWDRLTPADYGRVGGKLQAQYRRMTEMTAGIRDGEVSEAQALSRMRMYMGNARAEYFEVERDLLPPVPQGQARIERRTLGASKGGPCFPAGTHILTATGEKPIESIQIGEYVWTRYGLKAVTKTFARPYVGTLVCVRAKGRIVRCTPNHPFAVGQNEWIMAGMLGGQEPVLFEDCTHSPISHVAFPDTLNDKAASSKIFVSGRIPFLLRDLPRTQWLKTRMTMPPIAIGLDDELIADQDIDDELGFDQMMRHIRNAQGIEIGEQSQLQLRRLVALQSLVALEESYHCSRSLFPSVKDAFSESFSGPRSMARVMFAHSFGDISIESLVVNPIFAQSDPELLNPTFDNLNGQAKGLCNRFWPFRWIPFTNESIKFLWRSTAGSCRTWPSRIENRSGGMFSTKGLLAIVPIPTDGASAQTCSCSIEDFGFVIETQIAIPISPMTTDRASLLVVFQRPPGIGTGAAAGLRSIVPCLKGLTTMNTDFANGILSCRITHNAPPLLHRHNGHTYPLYDALAELSNKGCVVYNLEVEQVHEYVAEGFVVHNCDDCLRWAGMGWQAEGILPVPTQQSVCMPGNALVTANTIVRAFKRKYIGELVEITTALGHKLAATPHHPVATPLGWIGIGALHEEDQIVYDRKIQRVAGSYPDIVNVPTPISEVYDALAGMGNVKRIPSLPVDFHGDGRKQEVYVVWAEHCLPDSIDAPCCKGVLDFFLSPASGAEVSAACLVSSCVLSSHMDGLEFTRMAESDLLLGENPFESVGRCFVLPAYLAHRVTRSVGIGNLSAGQAGNPGSGAGLIGDCRLTIAPTRYASIAQTCTDSGSADSVPVRERQFGLSSDIPSSDLTNGQSYPWPSPFLGLTSIVSIRRFHFCGHVYNLTTGCHYYTTDGVIVQNCNGHCRCALHRAVVDAERATAAMGMKGRP